MAALAAPVAQAHFAGPDEDEHGVLWLAVIPTDEPRSRLDACTFYLRGSGMSGESGTFHIYVQMGPNRGTLFEGGWQGTPAGDGTWTFTVGPFTLEHSMREVEAWAGWLDEEATWHGRGMAPVDVECPHDPFYECADTLAAVAHDDGSITLTWDEPALGADRYHVYWTFPFGTANRETVEGSTTWTHEDTEAGTSYQYLVKAEKEMAGRTRADECGQAEVTAVPFFGAPLLGGLALAGSVGAYALSRRR